ncbi:diadenylate cyclase CdaA [Myxococcota bacterium]|nr:diadenylate cyclase CdaA [Myxococcota bacterium]
MTGELFEFLREIGPIIDAAIVYYVIYRLLLLIKGTRAVPMLIGLLAMIVLYFLSQDAFMGLPTFNWLLEKFIGSLFLIIVVVFQADIRRALVAFGGAQFFTNFRSASEAQVLDELVKVSTVLAEKRIGALIIIERDANLDAYMEEAVKLDARVSKELLHALFVPERQNPLHDGAVVVRHGRVAAAGVFLPMSVNPQNDRALGTRHRAALGLSEETDAVVIVVSEERGVVSVALDGHLERELSPATLRDRLTDLLIRKPGRVGRRGGRVAERPSTKGDAGAPSPPAPPSAPPPPEA